MNNEFNTLPPEIVVLAIFDKLKVRLPLWQIYLKLY